MRNILLANGAGAAQADANVEALWIDWKRNETAGRQPILDSIEIIEHEQIDIRLVHISNYSSGMRTQWRQLRDHAVDDGEVFGLGDVLRVDHIRPREADRDAGGEAAAVVPMTT